VYAVGNSRLDHFNGTGWSTLHTNPAPEYEWYSVWASGPQDVWIAGYESTNATGQVTHWNGAGWSTTFVGSYTTKIWGTGPLDVYVNAYPESIHYDGAWNTITGLSAASFCGTSAMDVFANAGGVAHYTGSTWDVDPATVTLGSASCGGVAGDMLFVGAQGRVMRFDGITWTILPTPTFQTLIGVWGYAPGRAFIVGDNGLILY
jgi:hypothetical protein